ncbi:VWA domain-containing protein [Prauserella muralis]|uniref:VWA domain-containing protein n=1 Tax=Prauserella muralis TaxID=588067 RepID=A0A2V4AGE4_9PSEU|nr:VWA domain-containing protein [Prauserella muralis]PXY19002.1 VWA domain-containing protein [Prauserella muralis]TWE28894.1 Ca-activated chloride channel family protein [Prauserella muralis]
MTFLSPGRLWLLLAVAALLVAYLVLQRRRSRYAMRFTNLPLLERVSAARPGWRRHVPAGLFLAMLGLLVVGFARPADEVQVPRERATVLVAVDVSLSMRATDVQPDRLAAARDAAAEFVGTLPEEFNVGLVAFAGNATVVVPPVTDRDALLAGLDRLSIGNTGTAGTAIGEAIAASLEAVRSLDARAATEPPPARVVLLSDGANTSGRSPAEMAAQAATEEIPVDTISVGTEAGEVDIGGRTQGVPVDGETLRMVAEQTGGAYHEAATASELREVYGDIGSSVGFRSEQRDVSSRFIGFGLVFALATAGTSMLWFSRIP